MNILYLGDVMGPRGIEVVERLVPDLRKELSLDLVVAQSENVTDGRGLSVEDYQRLRKAGVDCCTGGNWTLYREDTIQLLADPNVPVIRPANYPEGTPGKGYVYVETPAGPALVISLLGQIVGKDADKPVNNPLRVIDAILEQEKAVQKVATVVNFHGDFSSEKVVIGHYLDGRVSMVVGDHWHVPTADTRILPGGTAHTTDVGMCGTLNSSLGVAYDVIVSRWRDGHVVRNELETNPPLQCNAIMVTVGQDGRATHAERIYRQLD